MVSSESHNIRTSSVPPHFKMNQTFKVIQGHPNSASAALTAPFITELCNRSLSSGVFPAPFKSAFITPLMKKPDMDPADCKSYRVQTDIKPVGVVNKTAELSQRRPRDAPNIWVHWKVLRVLTTHPTTFPEMCNGLLFRSILRMCVQNLKFV